MLLFVFIQSTITLYVPVEMFSYLPSTCIFQQIIIYEVYIINLFYFSGQKINFTFSRCTGVMNISMSILSAPLLNSVRFGY